MTHRSATFLKACRVLRVDPTAPLEDMARRYHALAQELRSDDGRNDPATAARVVALNGAWARIKYETRKRRMRLTRMLIEPEQALTICTWPRPAAVRSQAFDGCELRPTEHARCYRVLKDGVQLLILHRHPADERLLFARNERGRVVRVNGVGWWTDVDGEVRPVG